MIRRLYDHAIDMVRQLKGRAEMKALLLNTLLGICMGRFLSIWTAVLFVPLVAAEVAYGIYMHDIGLWAIIRRGTTLLATAELAFLLGALLRPKSGKAWG